LVFGLTAVIGLMAPEARAGTLTMTISWGTHTVTVTPGSALALPGSSNSNLQVDTASLNSQLNSGGSAFNFSNLGSNSVGKDGSVYPVSGTLNEGGTAAFTNAGGLTTITISAVLDGYTNPTGNGTLTSGTTALFTNANAGDSQSVSTSFNGATVATWPPPPIAVPSPAPSVFQPTIAPKITTMNLSSGYTLDTSLTLSLTSGNDAFGVSIVAATVVPEPASLVLMLIGMPLPLVVAGLLRRRAGLKSPRSCSA